MWAEIARLSAGEQVTVLLTTHYLDEADRLADRLAIVDHGRVVVEGTPDELKSGLRGDAVDVDLASAADAARAAAVLGRVGPAGCRRRGEPAAGPGGRRCARRPRRARGARRGRNAAPR